MYIATLFLLLVVCKLEFGISEDVGGSDQTATLADIKELQMEISAILREHQQKTDMLMDVVTEQEREIQALKSDIARLSSEERGRKNRKRVAEVPNTGIAFYAQLSADQSHFGTHQTVIFDRVRTNIGNAYNHDDGVFTAPCPGVYVFFWTTANRDNSHMQTELVVNGGQYGRVWADSGDHADYSMASNTVVVSLDTGNTVWIRSDTISFWFHKWTEFRYFLWLVVAIYLK
ncbi:heavy metal-binding protein HIP-like isoform X2 [Pecten maximus]|uniref:heavy metal-binding protein HIP-like isoform X2 n=1 Tax=Pecten maximus TaxID=6579 RepID=UPI0014590D36|nr:heavy metal-binding protein HIP-like isoform X2 [Pecten maximus]